VAGTVSFGAERGDPFGPTLFSLATPTRIPVALSRAMRARAGVDETPGALESSATTLASTSTTSHHVALKSSAPSPAPAWVLKPDYEWCGLGVAAFVVALWSCTLRFGLLRTPASMEQQPVWLTALLMLALTHQYTGLFITAHDAMHGLVLPKKRRLNDLVGTFCALAFAGFDYKLLHAAHWRHHAHPASPKARTVTHLDSVGAD